MIIDSSSPAVPRTTPEPVEGALAKGLMRVLLDGVYAVRAVLRRADCGELTMPQFRLLVSLASREGASLSQAAEVMGLSAPATSRLVDGLVCRQLVHRVELPSDRRRVSLSLTTDGRQVLDSATGAVLAHLTEQLSPLNTLERDSVAAALDILGPLLGPAEKAARR